MKKRFFALCCIAMAAALVVVAHSFKTVIAAAQMTVPLRELPVIVIDAGHGGFDGGAVGVDGVIEKDINLAIAKKLHQLFLVNGYEAVLTREEDCSLEDAGLDTVRKRKNSDIHNRLAKAQSYPDCLLLSIHQNKYTLPQYSGAQVFYGPENAESERIAKIMQARLIELLQPENTRQAKVCGDSVYLIHHATMPALLVECGFLSNPEEAAKLQEPSYQNQVAFTIFAATAEALGAKFPEYGADVTQMPQPQDAALPNDAQAQSADLQREG